MELCNVRGERRRARKAREIARLRNIPPTAVQHDQTRAGVSVWSAAIPFDAANLLLHAARSFFRCSSNNTSSFPRRVFCARGLKLWLRYPRFKGWRSAERRTGARTPVGLHVTRQARHLARRLASHNAGRPPPGALTVAILGSGAALPSPTFAPDQSQRAPRARVVVPGGRLSVPPETTVPEPPPRDATPRSVFRYGSRTRPE
jgi:hypothetical protein